MALQGDPNAARPSPDEVERNTLLSRSHWQFGDSGEALRLATVACDRLAGLAVPAWFAALDADARQHQGHALLLAGDALRARDALEQALALRIAHEDAGSPWIAEARKGLARCIRVSGGPAREPCAAGVRGR